MELYFEIILLNDDGRYLLLLCFNVDLKGFVIVFSGESVGFSNFRLSFYPDMMGLMLYDCICFWQFFLSRLYFIKL